MSEPRMSDTLRKVASKILANKGYWTDSNPGFHDQYISPSYEEEHKILNDIADRVDKLEWNIKHEAQCTKEVLIERDSLRAEIEALKAKLVATLSHFDNAFGLQMQSILTVTERDHEFKMENRKLKEENEALKKSLAEEYPDLDALPEWTPDQRAEMDADFAEFKARKESDLQKISEYDALKQENEALRADRERLDWLEQQKSQDFEWYMQRLDSGGKIPQSIRHGYYTHDERFQTLREAVDAARTEKA